MHLAQTLKNRLVTRCVLPIAVLCGLAGAGLFSGAPAWAQGDIVSQRMDQSLGYQRQLATLANVAESQGLSEAAAATRAWFRPRHERLAYFEPTRTAAIDLPGGNAAMVAAWHKQFLVLRQQQADALFALAQQAARDGKLSLAFELVNDTLRENPDHAAARRLVGDVPSATGWSTPYEAEQTRLGLVWHNRYGWLPAAQVERYEGGERYHNGQWISAERDAEVHANLNAAWKIETEHFTVTTNHSLEGGVELGEKLERLHRVWRQLFAGYYGTASQWKAAFAGGAVPALPRRRHSVMFLKDRDEFQGVLRGEIPPGLEVSGIYLSKQQVSYFYADENRGDTTLNHETTHQLFHEARRVVSQIGSRANAWVIEGVACFMESLAFRGSAITVGGLDAYRVQDQRYYMQRDKFYLPTKQLTDFSVAGLQRQPNLGVLYAQSASLVDLLMFASGGAYRDGLVDYLLMVYVGRDRPGSLSLATGWRPEEIDTSFKEWTFIEDDDLARMPPSVDITYLVLGGSGVTDEGLTYLDRCQGLRWLDVAATRVTDEGLPTLSELPHLTRLDLTGTRVSDQGLEILAALPKLEALAVEQTLVTEAGIAKLRAQRPGMELKH